MVIAHRSQCALTALFGASVALAGPNPPATIFFTSDISVGKSIAGTNTRTGLMNFPFNGAIGVTVQDGFVYASTSNPSSIWRCGLSGQSPTQILSRGSDVYVRQVQFLDHKMYWNEQATGTIFRANPDGTAVQTVMTGPTGDLNGIWDFTLANNRIYWTSWDSTTVKSTRLDGTDPQQIDVGGRVFSIESLPNGLVVSGSNGTTGFVNSMGFDGSNLQTLATQGGVTEMNGLSLFDSRAYFSWSGAGGAHVSSVSLSGGAVAADLVGGTEIFQISVVPAPWTLGVVGAVLMSRRRRML